MNNKSNFIIIKLQMGLNQKMYDIGKISYEMFSKANEILISRLQSCNDYSIITLNEKII